MNIYREAEIPDDLAEFFEPVELGLEPTPAEYVANMVAVGREIWRVLRDDGVFFLNIGDCYAHNGPCGGESPDGPRAARATDRVAQQKMHYAVPSGMKPKDLVGIPWALAFALRDAGWYLRDPIIWSKGEVDDDMTNSGSPMPGSQQDRCTSAHEMIFMLSKKPRYYYDQQGCLTSSGAILRNVWRINPEPNPFAHFASFPREVPRRCIALGSSEKGCCPDCGAPWKRITKSDRVPTRPGNVSKVHKFPSGWNTNPGRHDGVPQGIYDYKIGQAKYSKQDAVGNPTYTGFTARWADSRLDDGVIGNRDPGRHCTITKTIGWEPTCKHHGDPVPCTVLDPFSGSGTSGVVALALGRNYVGLDINPEYHEMARQRIEHPHAPVKRPNKNFTAPLFDGLEME
jgi:DNA modification methylase